MAPAPAEEDYFLEASNLKKQCSETRHPDYRDVRRRDFDKWVCKVVRVLFCGIATRQFHMRVRVVRVTTRTRQ